MKRLAIFALLLLMSGVCAFAQLATADIIDPQQLLHNIQEMAQLVSTAETTIQQLQEADQMVQYQIMALQQLSSGTWTGFVSAWGLETATLQNLQTLSNQIPALGDALDMNDFMKGWYAATGIVNASNTIIQDTQSREQLWNQTMANSSGSQTLVGQLQTTNYALSLVGGELADLQLNFTAWRRWAIYKGAVDDNADLTLQDQWRWANDYSRDPTTAVVTTWPCTLSQTGPAQDLSQIDAGLDQ
jgi:hypothetical protein